MFLLYYPAFRTVESSDFNQFLNLWRIEGLLETNKNIVEAIPHPTLIQTEFENRFETQFINAEFSNNLNLDTIVESIENEEFRSDFD